VINNVSISESLERYFLYCFYRPKRSIGKVKTDLMLMGENTENTSFTGIKSVLKKLFSIV